MSKLFFPTNPQFSSVHSERPTVFSRSTPVDVDAAPRPTRQVSGPLRIDMPTMPVHAEVLRRITPDFSPIPATAFLESPPQYTPTRDRVADDSETMLLMPNDSGDGWRRSGLTIYKNDHRVTSSSRVSSHELTVKLFPVDSEEGSAVEFSISDSCKTAGAPLVLEPSKNNVGKRLFELQEFDPNTKVEVSVLKSDPDVILAQNPGTQNLWQVVYSGLSGTEFEGCTITLYVGMTSVKGFRHKDVFGIKVEGDTRSGTSFLEQFQKPPLKIARADVFSISFSWQALEGQVVDTGTTLKVIPEKLFFGFYDFIDSKLIVVGRENSFCTIEKKTISPLAFTVKYDARYEMLSQLCHNQWVYSVDLPENEFSTKENIEDEERELSSQIRLIRKPKDWQVQLMIMEPGFDPKITSLTSESCYIESQQLHVLKISRKTTKTFGGFCEYIAVKIQDSGEVIKRTLTQEEYQKLKAQQVSEMFSWSDEDSVPPEEGLVSPTSATIVRIDPAAIQPRVFDVDVSRERVSLDYPYQVGILGLNPGRPEVAAKWLGGPFLNSVWQGQKEAVSVGIDSDSRIIRVMDEIEDAHYYVPVGEETPRQYIYLRSKPERFNDEKMTYLPRLLEREDVDFNLSSGNILITLPAADMDAEAECLQINGVFIQVENGVASFGFDRDANWESQAVESVALSSTHSILRINDDVFLFPVIVENTVRIAIAPYPPDIHTVWLELPHATYGAEPAVEQEGAAPKIADEPRPIVPAKPPEVASEPIFDASRKPAEVNLGRLVDHYQNNALQLQSAILPSTLTTENLLNGSELYDGMLISTGMLPEYKMIWSYPNRNERIRFVGERIARRYANDKLDFGGNAGKSPFVWSLDMHLTIRDGVPVPAFPDANPVAKLIYRFPHSKTQGTVRVGTLVNTPIEERSHHSQAKFVSDPSTNLGWYLVFENFAGTGQTVLAIPYVEIIKVSGMKAPMMGFYMTNTGNKLMPEAIKKSLTRINKSLARDASFFIPRPDQRYSFPRAEDTEPVVVPVTAIESATSLPADSGSQEEQQRPPEDATTLGYDESPDLDLAPVLPQEIQEMPSRADEMSLPNQTEPPVGLSLQGLAADLYARLPEDTAPMFRLQLGLLHMGYAPNQEQKTLIEVIMDNFGRHVDVEKFESLKMLLANYPKDIVLSLSKESLRNLLNLSAEDGRIMLPFFQAGHVDLTQVQQVISWFKGSIEQRSAQALAFLNAHPGSVDVVVKNLSLTFGDINLYGLFQRLKADHTDFFEKTLYVVSRLEDSENKIRILDCLKIYHGLNDDARSDLVGEWNDFIQSSSNREQGFGRFLRNFLRQHAQMK